MNEKVMRLLCSRINSWCDTVNNIPGYAFSVCVWRLLYWFCSSNMDLWCIFQCKFLKGLFTVADWDNPVTFITLTSGRMFQTSDRMILTSGRMFQTSGRPHVETSGRTLYNKHPAESLMPNLVLEIFELRNDITWSAVCGLSICF